MINLIARMSEVQFDSEMPYKHLDADQGSLASIEHDLTVLKQDTTCFSGTNISEEVNRGSKMSKLYQLAGLIYFERVLKRYPNSIRVARWSGEAFDLLRELVVCERPFPLFFIACEAHTDTQRELILSILERTHNRSNQRRLYPIQAMIESMWVQHDLISDSNTEERVYVDTLNAVMSSNELLPTLA
jgi:hypothetical protein